jgi:uncharacterized membrane protein
VDFGSDAVEGNLVIRVSDANVHPEVSDLPEAIYARRVRQVELLISALLRVGVSVSLSIVVLGTIFTFVHHRQYLHSRDALPEVTGEAAKFPHTISEVIRGVRRLEGRSIVLLGLLLLIATPVMRVAVSILAFVYEHDRTYVIITSIVLALLLLSFVLGRAEG